MVGRALTLTNSVLNLACGFMCCQTRVPALPEELGEPSFKCKGPALAAQQMNVAG
jgi:hypothetical protein